MTPEVFGKIDHIAYYPVKGAAGMGVTQARLTKEGLTGDREFMIVSSPTDENGIYNFVTQRDRRGKSDKPQGLADLVLIKPQIVNDQIILTWKGQDPIEIPRFSYGHEIPVRIWDDLVQAEDQGDKLAQWLSDHLSFATRLVKAAGAFQRDSKQNYIANDNTIRFQDGYPIHWFYRESVDELSEIANEAIPYGIFRPNIVVSGSPAQTEHLLFRGELSGIPFINPKPCDRCPVTNVDQITAEVKVGRALRHLAKYKRWIKNTGEQVVIFGENMLPQGEGVINVGDEVILTERRNPPLKYGPKV